MIFDIKAKIKHCIQSFNSGKLTENGLSLFKALGYITDRQAPLNSPTFDEFRENYIIESSKFNYEKAQVLEWKYIDILFQLSKEEVLKQTSLFDTNQVDRTIIETYLFITIGLSGNEYSRSQLAKITREVNRIFAMPVLILFKYNSYLTLSVINRRLHKRDETKDVLEKVTLIKDIRIDDPHRAHIEILYDLSFDELNRHYHFSNFVELHNAWQKTLDIKELNKRFYSELFNWYLWATRSINFPKVDDVKDLKIYNSECVIRLLTRIIFIWFIKEKRLVPDGLFEVNEMKKVLKNFNPQSTKTSIYYRAILQNLFFATLNTQMDKDVDPDEKRRFVNLEPKYQNPDYTDQTKYRYKDYFNNPDEALKLFSSIPFLNGGLFECLDSKDVDSKTGKEKEFRYDGFSTYEEKQAFVPDKLFFANEFFYDLNDDYGTKGKSYKVEGLLNVLSSYKFTITENTPLDEEIALDPELLGKVFENLLASYNPETQITARKQTGSFYTPREIVNYMVDESLITYLKQYLSDSNQDENRLRQLFAPVVNIPEFTKEEKTILVNAISSSKILDPACGSGAFPMGILHRIVDLLNKLDPDNQLWFISQKQRAINETSEVFNSGDTQEREIRLNEINKAFDLSMNYPDYARKLFLIENCIFGVDIQQIAIQISKLRFFISLIVDQKVDDNKPNRNILSMPNLETRFVAANTLIGLDKPTQLNLIADNVRQLESELLSIRHKIFYTRKYQEKKELKKQDKSKRQELQNELEKSGYTKNTAAQMAGWNPFDPVKSATFFDVETMFGFNGGFNIVIGNPPYGVDLTNDEKKYLDKKYKDQGLKNRNSAIYFILVSDSFLTANGTNSFIVPKSLSYSQGWGSCARFLLPELIGFYDTGKSFENVLLEMVVFLKSKGCHKSKYKTGVFKNESFQEFGEIDKYIYQKYKVLLTSQSLQEMELLLSILEKCSNTWGDYVSIERGLNWQSLVERNIGKTPVYRGAQLNKYYLDEPTDFIELNNFDELEYEYQNKPKILNQLAIAHVKNPYPHFFLQAALDKRNIKVFETISCTFLKNPNLDLRFLLGINNSKLFSWLLYKFIYNNAIRSTRYDEQYISKIPCPDFVKLDQKPIISIIDDILARKKSNKNNDVSQLESKLDKLVYELYGLSEADIKIIESKTD